jgi:copper chaperone CopZ
MAMKFLIAMLLVAGAARAEFLHMEVFIRDMNCQPCTESLAAAFKRMRGVDNVDVDFQAGTVKIDLAKGNRVGVEQAWDAIKRVGFTPGETKVRVRGTVKLDGAKKVLEVEGVSKLFAIEGDDVATGETELRGTTQPPPDPRTMAVIKIGK